MTKMYTHSQTEQQVKCPANLSSWKNSLRTSRLEKSIVISVAMKETTMNFGGVTR